jgi:hypothetical protein
MYRNDHVPGLLSQCVDPVARRERHPAARLGAARLRHSRRKFGVDHARLPTLSNLSPRAQNQRATAAVLLWSRAVKRPWISRLRAADDRDPRRLRRRRPRVRRLRRAAPERSQRGAPQRRSSPRESVASLNSPYYWHDDRGPARPQWSQKATSSWSVAFVADDDTFAP